MLESHAEAAPRQGEAFLVVDPGFVVQALSQQAEALLGVSEEHATNRQLAELLVGADAEQALQDSLVSVLQSAAAGHDPPGSTFVRPRATFGVRLRARISACGPPRAALIVLEAPGSGAARNRHLRVVSEAPRTAKSA
jgi:PAS domain-containing protein